MILLLTMLFWFIPVLGARWLEMPGTGTTTPADIDLAWHANCRIIGFGGGWPAW